MKQKEKSVGVHVRHYVNRVGWLRAAVLGANDGIISTTSLVIGVASANADRGAIIVSAVAGLVAGAMSMAAGEYVSVSSQEDVEVSDLRREQKELDTIPDLELKELENIYIKRGLDEELAAKVARQLTEYNALEAHAREELGINDVSKAKPLQAALASLISFIIGGILPLLVSFLAPVSQMVTYQYIFALVFLILLGIIAAKTGGADIIRSLVRICIWGTLAMGVTALIGSFFDIKG
ncbi:VIT family protein [Apibacter sp. HY039]|uniref:VIT1/CCC1 transporter family protein n=1 Tax=Apibacter sp. HY039 TaxID=2501476 RepID=UPI000FEBBFD4|nr:VIT family protein [Apibacter sp. HY039]